MRETINITRGTDVVLNDRLVFRGNTFDPSLATNLEAFLISAMGVRVALGLEVVDDYLVIRVPWVTGRMTGLYGLEVRGVTNGLRWATYADSLIRYTTKTTQGESEEVTVTGDAYDITQQVSYRFEESPISETRVTVDGKVGEPSVAVSYASRVLQLAFSCLKGNGIRSIEQTASTSADNGANVWTVTLDDGSTAELTIRNGSRGNGISEVQRIAQSDDYDGVNTWRVVTTDGGYFDVAVKNGSRGNGIESFVKIESSDEDGGVNTWRQTLTDGEVIDISVRNGRTGPQGPQGDSVIVGEGDLPLAHVTGQSTEKAISQKGFTDALLAGEEAIPLTSANAAKTGYYITSPNNPAGQVWAANSGNHAGFIYAVRGGETYRFVAREYSCYFAWLTDDDTTVGATPHFAQGTTASYGITHDATTILTAPADASFIFLKYREAGGEVCFPQSMDRLVSASETARQNSGRLDALEGTVVDTSALAHVNVGISGGKWAATTGSYKNTGKFLPVEEGETYRLLKPDGADSYFAVLLTSDAHESGTVPAVAQGSTVNQIWVNWDQYLTVPQGATHLFFRALSGAVDCAPTIIKCAASDIKRAVGKAAKSVSILYVGNSLTQDGAAYLPLLLNELAPDLDYRLSMWYVGGKTLAQQYQYFVNGTNCEMFSTNAGKGAWRTVAVPMQTVLENVEFDILVLQEYMNYQTEVDVTAFNQCVGYIRQHYHKPFRVACLLHPPLRSAAEEVYARTVAENMAILSGTEAMSVIDTGAAVMEAMSTSLDSLGDKGHLSPDGTHTQEGLPCLLQTYVHALWLFRQLGIPMGVTNSQLRITTDIYNALNVPGANLGTGVITGTDEQHAIAQLCAIKADKIGRALEMQAYNDIEA